MKKLKEYLVTMPKEQFLTIALAAAVGCIVGMFFSPGKTICCGNNNGAYYEKDYKEEE